MYRSEDVGMNITQLNIWINQQLDRIDPKWKCSDIHIDEIDSALCQPGRWIEGTISLLQEGGNYLAGTGKSVVIAAAFDLAYSNRPIGVNFTDLARQFTSTPPSLYLFSESHSSWIKTYHTFLSIDSAVFSLDQQLWSVLYLEYLQDGDVDYRRSLWIFPNFPRD
jgi:hypothetical protein